MTKLVNRAKMTTATTGTGTITLGTAVAGFQSFAAAGVVDGNVVRYVIEDGTAFEIGTGTFGSAGGTLTRTVSESSNADAALNLTGDAVVFVGATAADIPPALELYAENPSSPVAPSATGTNAVAIGTNSSASGIESVSIGGTTNVTGNYSIAVGNSNDVTGSFATAIGLASDATANYAVAIGAAAEASGLESLAIGRNTDATSSGALAIGYTAQARTGSYATAISRSYASGADSFAAAIANNTSSFGATGANSVAIGDLAKATSADAVAIGNAVTSQAAGAVVIGQSSSATGIFSTVIGNGCSTLNNHTYSLVIGRNGRSRGPYSFTQGVFGFTGAVGEAQSAQYVLAVSTTTDTPIDMGLGGATTPIILPNNSAYAFHGTIVARQQASQGTACAAFKIEGLIRREGNAASTVLVNSATTVLDNTPGFGMTLSADTVNGGLKIEVTGLAATNIRFVATVHTSEVSF